MWWLQFFLLVVYVGGAVVSMYINDPAAADVRPTKDIDISLEIASLTELEQIRKDLRNRGFNQIADEDVICRFRYRNIKVDVMSTQFIQIPRVVFEDAKACADCRQVVFISMKLK